MLIFHITEEKTWQKALLEGVYVPTAFDHDGFIHCSTRQQVLKVANSFYKDTDPLILLKIDPDKLDVPLVYENLNGKEELFPHVYGKLPIRAVLQALPFGKNQKGRFVFPLFL